MRIRRAGPGWPLRAYVLGLVLLFVVAATAGAWYGWQRAERETVRGATDDAAFTADLAAAQVSADLALLSGTVAQVAAGPGTAEAYARPEDCSLAFNVLGEADGGHLDVLRPDGSVACSSRPAPADGRPYARAGWLAEALRAPASPAAAPVTAAPVDDPRAGTRALVLAAPVPGPAGAVGVVAGFVNLERLGGYLRERYAGPRGLEFLVVNAESRVATRSADPARWIGVPLSSTPFTATGPADRVDVAGVRRLFGDAAVTLPVGERAGQGWRLYAGADRAAALATVRGSFGGLAAVLGLGLLVALAGTLLVHRRIARPIGQLGRAVRRAADDPGAHPVTVSGPREVIGLAHDFNRLLASVDRELTERRRAEEAAREHEENYRQLFVANPYPMFVLDARTLEVLQANDAAVAHYGYPRDELMAMALPDLCEPDDSATLARTLAGAAPVTHAGPIRQRTKNGTLIQVELTSQALSIGGRKVRCIVIDDVTARDRLERQLRQSQRLESLGQLAGGIAHDFNNLLGVIGGYAGMAAGEVSAAAREDARWRGVHEDLVQVQAAVDRSAALTRQLLSFARVELTQPRVLDLDEVIRGVEPLLRRTLGEDVQLSVRLADDLPPVRADAGQLEQVLVNLAVNARDAMPTGGTLVIDTGAVTVDGHYTAQRGGPQPGEYVRLRVSDTGAGMSQDVIDRAFEPFFTTKPKGQGTGLGLATIYGILTEAGGTVEIYSEPGMGTTVTAMIPAVASGEAGQAGQGPAGTTAPAADRGRGETILVVEDSAELRSLTERMLRARGYTVLAAADGPEAIRVAAAGTRIDLLLTDVVMPHMAGHVLAQELRRDRPELPVVYVSGYAEPILTTNKTLPPDVTLLTKPVTEVSLLAAIRDALDRAARPTPHDTHA